MGGLKQVVQQIWADKLTVAYRPPQRYAAAAHTIFTIVGGAVWIKVLFARCTEVIAAGSTFAVTVGGVAMQNAAVAIAGIAETLITIPLGAAAGQVIIPALVTQPPFSLANALLGQVGQGQLASPGNIVLTVGVALTDGDCEWYCLYHKLRTDSVITI